MPIKGCQKDKTTCEHSWTSGDRATMEFCIKCGVLKLTKCISKLYGKAKYDTTRP